MPMKNYARLAAHFSPDGIVDVQAVHDRLCRAYDIGYTALYDCGTHICLYIQTASKVTRMTPTKVLKICKEFGVTQTPKTFDRREGTPVAEIGSFRRCGRHSGLRRGKHERVPGEPVINTTNNINNTTNNNNNTTNNNNDNSVNTTNNNDNSANTTNNIDNSVNQTIHLSINAFGKEEISHIAEEQFKKLVLGSPEQVIDYMKKELPQQEYDRIVNKAWRNLRQPLFEKALAEAESARMSAERDATAADAEADAEAADSESTSSSEEDSDWEEKMEPADRANMMEELAYNNLVVNGEPIKYDGQPDSAYNKDAKAKVEVIAIAKHSIAVMSYWLPWKFAKLMYDCPHNSNLIHPSNAGYIKYYDGQAWIKQNACDVYMITRNWEKKLGEYFKMLEAKHGAEWAQSFQGWYISEIMRMFDVLHPDFAACENWTNARVKKEALLLIDNTNERLKAVKRRTGKRVNRVLDGNDFEVRDKKVLRRTTWEELMSM